jgi:hypothetical protein
MSNSQHLNPDLEDPDLEDPDLSGYRGIGIHLPVLISNPDLSGYRGIGIHYLSLPPLSGRG